MRTRYGRREFGVARTRQQKGGKMKLLKRLSETPGIPGREEAMRVIVREALTGHVDEISVDRLGNVIGHKKGARP